jgi:cardiolipin synthase
MQIPYRACLRWFCMLGACAVLAACANVPSVANLQARRQQVRLSDASGQLSLQRSRDIVDHLNAHAQQSDFLARHLEVEEAVSDAPLVAGNLTTLYDDGPSTYAAMLQAIADARHYIHMESYIFDDDEAGRQFAEALIASRQRGVPVDLMVDAFGTVADSDAIFERMRSAGVVVTFFNPLNPANAHAGWSPNERSHRKLLVVDGKVGFVGGINVSAVYESAPSASGLGSHAAQKAPAHDAAPWRDTHLRIQGPAVAEIDRVFVAGWRKQGGPAIADRAWLRPAANVGPAVVRILANDPDHEDGFAVYLTLMSAIQSARVSVHVTMAYFVPDEAFLQALADAAKRGVDVVLVLPHISDSSMVLRAGHSHYAALLAAGVKIYERRGALLHAKTAVVDGVWSTVGSSNMDWRSFTLNYEINAVVLGVNFGGEMEALFQKDLAASTRIDPAQWKERGFSERFMEDVSRIFERWL